LPSAPESRRLATVTVPAPDLRPEVFLSHAKGDARGFWARGSRWVAHQGIAAELRPDGDSSSDRFGLVAERASQIALNPVLPQGTTRAPRTRFYGGFSFRSDHVPEGIWASFPSCLFHLPAFELEGDDSGDAWLRARTFVEPNAADEVFVRLRHQAEALRAELASHEGRFRASKLPMKGIQAATDRSSWEGAVEECLAIIRGGVVSKVVLARTLDLDLGDPRDSIDTVEVVEHLWEANRGSHVFMFEPEPGSAIIGAAPETIATLQDGVFHATAVAGSIRRGSTPREQAELATRLLASDKDRIEQRIALDDMLRRLETVAQQIRTDPQPHVLTLARIQHLETEIRASVPAEIGILDLLRLLHPTPAVCGLPREAAMALLADEEPFDRGWYAGPVGWFDPEGNGIFAPALRTGISAGLGWRLFAGAGIIEGSVPALEWDETAIKFEPMLRALEASGVQFDRIETEGHVTPFENRGATQRMLNE